MGEFNCSLCNAQKYIREKSFKAGELIAHYKRIFKADVSRFFPASEFETLRCAECDLRTHYPALGGDSVFYDKLQNEPFYYESDKEEFSYAVNKILEKRPENVLDVGCGSGLFLKKIMNSFDVKGKEFSRGAEEKTLKAGIRLDSPSDKYDFIVLFQVLEHSANVKEFLDGIIGKLKEGGYLFISVPNNDSILFQEIFDILDYPPHHLSQWSRKALQSIARIYRLEAIEYFEEKHRVEHFTELVRCRRQKITGSGFKGRLVRFLGAISDRILAPYFLDHVDYPGHTHGMLYRKTS